MLSARVIPCLDVDAGRVVKGVKFKEIRMPVILWKLPVPMNSRGQMNWYSLILLPPVMIVRRCGMWLERTVATCFMPVTVGGGIRELEDVRSMLLAGADKVSMNTRSYP